MSERTAVGVGGNRYAVQSIPSRKEITDFMYSIVPKLFTICKAFLEFILEYLLDEFASIHNDFTHNQEAHTNRL